MTKPRAVVHNHARCGIRDLAAGSFGQERQVDKRI
jgi:hypothetical protein